MPVIQLDWEKIKSRFDGRTQLFAFTDQQAALLLSLSEQLTWDKTYRVEDYDFDDRDYLAAEVADTQRNLMMGVDLADLLGYIDDVEDLLRALQTIGVVQNNCCENQAPIAETHEQTTDYPDTVPDTWGDVEVEDGDHWRQLICAAAENYVAHLAGMGQQIDDLVGAGGIVIGAISGMLALLSGAGILLAIAYGTAAGVTTGILTGATLSTFDTAEEDINDARNTIVCAILDGSASALSAAVEAAVSGLAWTLWYQWVDYDSAYATMIDGFNANGTLAEGTPTGDCDCELELPETYAIVPWNFGTCSNPPGCDDNVVDGNHIIWNQGTGTSAQWTAADATPANTVGFLIEFTHWDSGGSGYWRSGALNGDTIRYGYPGPMSYEPTIGAFLVGLNAPSSGDWEDFVDDHPGSVLVAYQNIAPHNIKNENVPSGYWALGYYLWYIVTT
jgi:hypothetical protein